jgi:hypothetical protein
MEIFYAAVAAFLFVALKSFQQRNVAFDHYWPILPTSLLMAACEFYVVAAIVTLGYSLTFVLVVGFGGGLGSLGATILHKRIFAKRYT